MELAPDPQIRDRSMGTLNQSQLGPPRVLMLRPTNNIAVAGDLTSETLHWASDLVDLRETNNTFESEAVRYFWLDLKVSGDPDLPGNLA